MFRAYPRQNGHRRRSGAAALSWLPLLVGAGCLQFNPDFVLPGSNPAAQNTQQVSQNTPDTHTSVTPTEPSGHIISEATSQPSSSSSTSRETTSEASTTWDPTTTGSVTSGSSQTGTSSPESSTTSDSTTTTSAPATWRAITIDARQTTSDVPQGYTFAVVVDHAALVAAGAASNGSDLSIVARRGGTSTSLNRVLDPDSTWNSATTKIWFATDRVIGRGSLNNTEYFLAVGESGLAPVSNVDAMFLSFDDFDAPTLDSKRWSVHTSSVGTRSLSNIVGGIRLSASRHETYPLVYYSIRYAVRSFPSGIRVEAKTRFAANNLSGSCGRIFPITMRSQSDDSLRTALRSDLSKYGALSFNDVRGINEVDPINSATPTASQWQLHAMTWNGPDIRYYRDSMQLLQTQSHGNIKRPDQTPLQFELSAGAWKDDCSGSGSLQLDVDWVRIRRFMSPSPVARLE